MAGAKVATVLLLVAAALGVAVADPTCDTAIYDAKLTLHFAPDEAAKWGSFELPEELSHLISPMDAKRPSRAYEDAMEQNGVHLVGANTRCNVVCISRMTDDTAALYFTLPRKAAYDDVICAFSLGASKSVTPIFNPLSDVAPFTYPDGERGDMLSVIVRTAEKDKYTVECCGTNQICTAEKVEDLFFTLIGKTSEAIRMVQAGVKKSQAEEGLHLYVKDIARGRHAQVADCPDAVGGAEIPAKVVVPKEEFYDAISRYSPTSSESSIVSGLTGYNEYNEYAPMFVVEDDVDCTKLSYFGKMMLLCNQLDGMGCQACLACGCTWSSSGDGKCHQWGWVPDRMLGAMVAATTPVRDTTDKRCTADTIYREANPTVLVKRAKN